ncbi:MAG: hypothetical protein QFF03_14230 [Pseudomonadota bacterium]|nr:hypothetical protein [Pseudomonadota bacterium]
MRLRALLAAALLTCVGAACGAAPRCPAEVRVSLPNFEIAPYVLGTDRVEHPPGLLIEWTRDALARCGCPVRIVIKRRPPNRQLAEVATGLLDVLPGFAFSDNPDDQLVFPMKDGRAAADLAVLTDTVSLYVRAGERNVRWDGATLSGTGRLVGSSTGGAASAQMARARGWQIESAPTPQADLRKLIAGRIDVILEPDMVLGAYLRGTDALAVRKLLPPAQVTHRYAPVSKRFYAAHPEFTERFWRELCQQSHGRACR